MSRRRDPRRTERGGERLLSAVERLVDDADGLIAEVESVRATIRRMPAERGRTPRREVADRLIATYSTRSAIAGGITALPAIVPGAGTLVATVGGSMVDMAWMLKHEVEMALCLTYLYGFDIRDERERWIAYALVAVGTHEARSRSNYFADLAEAQLEAVAKYTPRQLSKLVLTMLGRLAVQRISRGLLRGVPLVGAIVGASANKLVTRSVGRRCVKALERRRRAEREGGGEVIEATIEVREAEVEP